jgi:molybdopterin-guanine dinucleotide biosynthesis protein A
MTAEPAGAIILAGGSSSRLGFDKRSLLVDGVPIVDHLYAVLRPWFAQILVGADAPGRWSHLDAEVVVDARPGVGPMMGLSCCLARARHDFNFAIACDIPRPRLDLVRVLLDEARAHDGAVPVTSRGFLEPLFCVYRRRVLPSMEELLESGERSLIPLLTDCDFARVALARVGLDSIANINTPRDLARLEAHVGRTG